MSTPDTASRTRSPWALGLAALLVGAVIWAAWAWREQRIEAALLRIDPSALANDTALLTEARRIAAPVFQAHCARCHGPDGRGHRAPHPQAGAANLVDSVWLYGDGGIAAIEQTILYGIRAGHPKGHHLTDMPALGRNGQLTAGEVDELVEYMLQLSGQAHDAQAASRGALVFNQHGLCYDCHGADGAGSPDYGATPLTGRDNSWLYGGDRDTLRKSLIDGRHGQCPAWIERLSAVQIRALAADLYQQAHSPSASIAAVEP